MMDIEYHNSRRHNHPMLQKALLAYERGWSNGMLGAQHKAALVAVLEEFFEQKPISPDKVMRPIFTVYDSNCYWSMPDGSNRCITAEDAKRINDEHWRPINTFDPRSGGNNALYVIAGIYPNGLRWVECCYWDPRGYFAGHKMDTFRPKWWKPVPEPPEE